MRMPRMDKMIASRLRFLPVALMACTGGVEPHDSVGDDTGAGTDSGGETSTVPYECPAAPTAPELSASSWTQDQLPPAGGIWTIVGSSDGSMLYAGSHVAGMWSSTNGGASWTASNVMVTHTYADLVISPDDSRTVYRSSGGILERSTDAGVSWTVMGLGRVNGSDNEAVYALAVAPWRANRLYAVVDDGTVYVSDDSGVSFEARGTLPVSLGLGGPAGKPANPDRWRILAPAEDGGRLVFADATGVYTSDDDGESWTGRAMSTFVSSSLVRQPGGPDHLMIGASDGAWESSDGGSSWLRSTVPAPIVEAAWSPDGSRLALAAAEKVYTSTDGGKSFSATNFDYPEIGALYYVDSERLIASWDSGLIATSDSGQTWTDASQGVDDPNMGVLAAHPACDNIVFTASICRGGVFGSSDWGGSWTHADEYLHYVMAVHFSPFNLDEIWVVSDERLVRSRDGGQTFDLVHSEFHFHGFALDPRSPGTMLLGSVGSGEASDTSLHVYKSEDDGESWHDSSTGLPTSRASAHSIAYWPGDSSVVLLGTYQGEDYTHNSGEGDGLFVSTDHGASWAESTLAARDIAWLATTEDSVVAATEDGLWRTKDKGSSWEKLSGPTGQMLSVDFRAGIGVALGKTGDTWRSDDQGETWSTLGGQVSASGIGWLAQIVVSADGTTAWATVDDKGVFRIAL